MNKITPCLKALLLITFILSIVPFQSTKVESETLVKTSNPQKAEVIRPSVVVEKPQTDCEGNWINSNVTGMISLQVESLSRWGAETVPTIVSETINSSNIVIIGHNICVKGECFNPGSPFGKIINIKIGEKVHACVNKKLYAGYVFASNPVDERQTSIMGDWTGFKTITMFTSYGKCKDIQCSSTDRRWVIAFERE
jgi:hypothetical protein